MNCIVTKLKEEVTGNFPFFEFRVFNITGNTNTVYNRIQFYGCSILSGSIYSDSACTTEITDKDNVINEFYIKPNESITVKVPFSSTYIYCINPTFTANLSEFNYFGNIYYFYCRFTNLSGDFKDLIEALAELDTFGNNPNFPNVSFSIYNTACKFNGASISDNLYVKRVSNVLTIANNTSYTNPIATYDISTKTWTFN